MIMFESDKSEKASIIIATDDQRKLLEQELEKIHQSSKEERAYVSGLIIDKDEIVTFIEEIEEIGIDTETDISISTIDSNDTSIKKDGDIGYLRSHIVVKGSWQNTMRALLLIENMPYGIVVNNIRLEGREDRWDMSLDVKALIK